MGYQFWSPFMFPLCYICMILLDASHLLWHYHNVSKLYRKISMFFSTLPRDCLERIKGGKNIKKEIRKEQTIENENRSIQVFGINNISKFSLRIQKLVDNKQETKQNLKGKQTHSHNFKANRQRKLMPLSHAKEPIIWLQQKNIHESLSSR